MSIQMFSLENLEISFYTNGTPCLTYVSKDNKCLARYTTVIDGESELGYIYLNTRKENRQAVRNFASAGLIEWDVQNIRRHPEEHFPSVIKAKMTKKFRRMVERARQESKKMTTTLPTPEEVRRFYEDKGYILLASSADGKPYVFGHITPGMPGLYIRFTEHQVEMKMSHLISGIELTFGWAQWNHPKFDYWVNKLQKAYQLIDNANL